MRNVLRGEVYNFYSNPTRWLWSADGTAVVITVRCWAICVCSVDVCLGDTKWCVAADPVSEGFLWEESGATLNFSLALIHPKKLLSKGSLLLHYSMSGTSFRSLLSVSPRVLGKLHSWYPAGPCGAPEHKAFLCPSFLWLQAIAFIQPPWPSLSSNGQIQAVVN